MQNDNAFHMVTSETITTKTNPQILTNHKTPSVQFSG